MRGFWLLRSLACLTAAGLPLLAFFPRAAAAADTDVLVLLNGDRITGEVKKLAGGRLEFKTDKAGTLQVKWDAVARVTSPRYFEVILDDARRLFGELLIPTTAGTLRVGTADQGEDTPFERVAQIDKLYRTFWSRINGGVDLGLSYTKADDKTEWNLDTQTSYRTPKRKISLSLDSTFRRSDTGDFDRDDFTGAFQRFWGGRWLSFTFASWQRNSELALDSRLLAGGGAGLHLVRNTENDLAISVGLDVAKERFTDGREGSDSAEALVGIAYELYALGGREFTVNAALTLFPSLTVSGRVRLESNFQVRRELFKNFYLNVQFFDSFDNHAEGTGATKNDLGVTTSVGWSF